MCLNVSDLMTRDPIAVRPNLSCRRALEVLLHEGIGEIYVTDDYHRLLGIVSDYELLKVQLYATDLEFPVSTLMSRRMMTVAADAPVRMVAVLFRDSRHRRIAVLENCCLVGLLERRDIMRQMVVEAGFAKQPIAGNSAILEFDTAHHGTDSRRRARRNPEKLRSARCR